MYLGDGLLGGRFVRRVNRFLALVELEGRETAVHVANSGRLGELFLPGAVVWVMPVESGGRKTAYDLALVEAGGVLVSVDARLPNALVAEAAGGGLLEGVGKPLEVIRESTFGESRFDLLLVGEGGRRSRTPGGVGDDLLPAGEGGRRSRTLAGVGDDLLLTDGDSRRYVEVKSVTLVDRGVGLFPDSPTVRGVKHLNTLAEAVRAGYRAAVVFVVQRGDATAFAVNEPADPALAEALRRAVVAGVDAYAYNCRVSRREVRLDRRVPIVSFESVFGQPGGVG